MPHMRILRFVALVGMLVATGVPALAQRGRGAGPGAQPPPPLNLPADTERITKLKTEAAAGDVTNDEFRLQYQIIF